MRSFSCILRRISKTTYRSDGSSASHSPTRPTRPSVVRKSTRGSTRNSRSILRSPTGCSNTASTTDTDSMRRGRTTPVVKPISPISRFQRRSSTSNTCPHSRPATANGGTNRSVRPRNSPRSSRGPTRRWSRSRATTSSPIASPESSRPGWPNRGSLLAPHSVAPSSGIRSTSTTSAGETSRLTSQSSLRRRRRTNSIRRPNWSASTKKPIPNSITSVTRPPKCLRPIRIDMRPPMRTISSI